MTRLYAFLMTLVLAFWVGGNPATAQDRGIEDTIGQQLEAFKTDDVGTAFGFASPLIKNIFRTPENFGAMVQQGYPMVWRPGEVTFLEQREIAGAIWQKVRIIDGTGRVHILDYQMIQSPDGWQINGVQLLREPEVSA
ncbi:MAG: DUF4864 domain-containing protein [Paracoccaceae bacterium]|uniref:DUF4864 domain-containing protein n=1 Tax=Seohaeicola saemankumensis TaxID=481181 RepID=UPI001E54BCB5|nr:DUF4864 domain-containing protein [Seohaeicola saemankumensis]MCD1626066.1 DUF4864 domain-containing protein [Seohaeicola saemankumensis]